MLDFILNRFHLIPFIQAQLNLAGERKHMESALINEGKKAGLKLMVKTENK